MSEYQYYEFQTIDRPLTKQEIDKLRSYSTRAQITSTSFVNHYDWGDFKGDENAWMEKYFDAFLYYANWGTHILKLRLPSSTLDLETSRLYCSCDSTSAWEKGGKTIISFTSEPSDEMEDAWRSAEEDDLSSLISLRSELAHGDFRCLYLAWLACAQNGEFDDDDPEPPLPSGLKQLSASLESFAGFMRVDADLLHVAAQLSPPLGSHKVKRKQVLEWVAKLPSNEKDELLAKLIRQKDTNLAVTLSQRALRTKESIGNEKSPTRTVSELLHAADKYRQERRHIAALKALEERSRRKQEVEAARKKYLDALTGRQEETWLHVDRLIDTKQPKKYNQALTLLTDLHDLAMRNDKNSDFQQRYAQLKQRHVKKPSLMNRLVKLG